MSMPVIRLRQPAQFPANVYGDKGIDVSKANGNYTVQTDWSDFAATSVLPTSPTNNVLTYDTVSNNYLLVPTSQFSGPTIRYDIQQGLDDGQQTQARKNVYAAPFDAMAYSGMQINGGFDINQEKGTATMGPGNILDGWTMSVGNSTGVLAANQTSAGAVPITSGVYFPRFLLVTATTALTAPAPSEYTYLAHNIEGYRTQRLGWGMTGALPITISFWIYPTIAGTLAVAAHNNDHTRSYVVDVPVTAATWQYKTVTIPGDTAGTWDYLTGAGLRLFFASCTGTNYQTPAGAWVAGNKFATPATTNLFSSTGNGIYMAGLTVLPGIEAPSAARSSLIMRPSDQELLTCQRYYQKSYNYATPPGAAGVFSGVATGIAYSTVGISASIAAKPRMRAAPTITLYSYNGTAGTWSAASNADTAAAAAAAGSIGETGTALITTTGLTAGALYYGHYVMDARL